MKKSAKRPQPRVPEGTIIYAIGDIHGRADCLETVFNAIDTDPTKVDCDRSVEIYLGDYVDRGPQSMTIIDMLLDRVSSHSAVTLKGNHESLFQDALADPRAAMAWRQFGGLETMTSYGPQVRLPLTEDAFLDLHHEWVTAVPDSHRVFLDSLPLFFSDGDYYFCHAGVRPRLALDRQVEDDLLWIRDEFLQSTRWHGARVVHGHTPVEAPEILPNRINLDTGAYMTGRLACLRLENDSATVL